MDHKEKDPDFSFKPLTEGLGFHPFSDGLPYTPARPRTQTPAKTPVNPKPLAGTGATAAGLPRPVRVTAPATFVRTAQTVTPTIMPQPLPLLEPVLGFGYLAKRVLAYCVDTFLNLLLCGGGLLLAVRGLKIPLEQLMSLEILIVGGLFLLTFSWVLIVAQEVAFGGSLGKRLFGLSLEGGAAAVFIRAFFFLLSVGCFGVGLLWAIFDPKRRCLHDLIVDLQPAEVASL